MLPRVHRLKKKKDIAVFLRGARAFSYGGIVLKIRENNLPVSRFAFVIGRRVAQKAVERNRIRRMLREIVRKKLALIKKNVDGVIIVRNATENGKKMEGAIDALFWQAGILS